MDTIDVVIVVLVVIFIVLFVFCVSVMLQTRKSFRKDMSYEDGVYAGPAGDPWWDGKLPEKVDDYTEPRYVYEDLFESTDFLPKHGRIVGYRVSPSLVIHSRVQHAVNPPIVWDYLERFKGKFLEDDEIHALIKNWKKVSELRVKAGDTPLECKFFWAKRHGKPVAYKSDGAGYKDSFGFPDVWYTLILKR